MTKENEINPNAIYKVQMRTHYGMDLHDYYTVKMTGKELIAANHNKKCIGHTYDLPDDNVNTYELLNEEK